MTEQEEREFQKAMDEAGGIDAFLRAHGYDPDEVGKRFQETAQDAIEEQNLLTVWRWVKRYGGVLNFAAPTKPIIVLITRHMRPYWMKEFDNLTAAADWVRQQEAQQ